MALVSTCLATLVACGGRQPQATPSAAGGAQPTPNMQMQRPPLSLPLHDAQHQEMLLQADGRQPLLLYLFATYDGVSQAGLTPLRQVKARCGGLRLFGVAMQPEPALLLEAWRAALQPPFEVAYEPTGALLVGQSSLGAFAVVPAYVLFDRQGRELGRIEGFASERRLLDWLRLASGACDVAVHDAHR